MIASMMMQPVVVQVPQIVEKEVIVRVPVKLNANDKKQIRCLAENTYFEAANQSVQGKIAVNNVVMNRVSNDYYASTPCAVIQQKKAGVCQFSWVCQPRKMISDLDAYTESYKVAENVYLKNLNDVTGGAIFYHSTSVNPTWNRVYQKTRQIGEHIFYKQKD